MSDQNDIDLSKLRDLNEGYKPQVSQEGYKPKHIERTPIPEKGYKPIKNSDTSTPPPKKP